MLDRFSAFWTKVISPVAHLLIKLGVSADAVTLVGTLGVAAGALVFFPQGKLLTGVLVISAFVFSDLIDGYMARLTGKSTSSGPSWTPRWTGSATAPSSPVSRCTSPGPATAALPRPGAVCLVMGGVTSYARARAEGLGFQAKVGIAERADRLVAILVMTGFSAIFDLPVPLYVALWALAVASTVTVVQRIWVVRRQALEQSAAAPPAEPASLTRPAPGLPAYDTPGHAVGLRPMAETSSSATATPAPRASSAAWPRCSRAA